MTDLCLHSGIRADRQIPFEKFVGIGVLLLVELHGSGAFAAPVITEILCRPTASSVTVNARADADLELYFEYGRESGRYDQSTARVTVTANEPAEIDMTGLVADSRYFYRIRYRTAQASDAYQPGPEHSFYTQRRPGSTFTFALQGDSHPEREKSMFSPDL